MVWIARYHLQKQGMKTTKPPLTPMEIAQVALSFIRRQKKRFNLPEDYREWLLERESDLERQITTKQFTPLKANP